MSAAKPGPGDPRDPGNPVPGDPRDYGNRDPGLTDPQPGSPGDPRNPGDPRDPGSPGTARPGDARDYGDPGPTGPGHTAMHHAAFPDAATRDATDRSPADRIPARPKTGLVVASLVTGSIGLVLAVSTWAAWLLVLPGFRDAQPYNWIAVVFGLVLGALWFLVLPLGTVSIIVGLLAIRRAPALAPLARLGLVIAALALAAALGGAAVFVIDASTGPPVYPLVPSGE
ncbi:hypothetical protein ABZ639_03110 [Saccharomonospora sp. NPDC006951]